VINFCVSRALKFCNEGFRLRAKIDSFPGPDFDGTDRIQLAKCRPKFCSYERAIKHTDFSDHDLLKTREAV
jgi:hypothetical protein